MLQPQWSKVKRIVVLGTSGSGKTTLAGQLSKLLDIPHVELDGLYHGPNWSETPDEVFFERVAVATAEEKWVVDGGYHRVRHLTWDRADLLIWIDLPFPTTFSRVVRRTLRRCYRREILWNGNRERLWPQFFAKDSLFLWVVQSYRRNRRKYTALLNEMGDQKMVRLRNPQEVAEFVAQLSRAV
jgi:adenylate kinase family enzyme